jgi:RNA polymerase sigma-70 factor (ECF subfamily)
MSEHLEPEELLEHTGWMTSLARSLVLEADRAEDVVQETFLQVATRRPQRPQSLGAWLRGVVTHLSLKDRRSGARRRRREERAARPERDDSGTEALVERAELHRLVVDRVIELPEPYRTAILLRYFDDLSAGEVARRLEVPVATARTRIQRGIERLRRELDGAHGGDRRLWLGLLAPLAGLELISAQATAATSTTAGSAAAAASTTSFATAHAGAQALAIAGAIMTQKTVLAVLVTGIITLAAGLGLGTYVARVDREEAMSRYELVEARRLEDAEARLAAAAADLKKARAAGEELAEEKEALESKVKGLDEELKGEREKAALATPAKGELPVAFGEFAELEGLTNADWPVMGKAILTMNGLFKDLLERLGRGEPVGPELQKLIAEENAKLVQLAIGVMGKIPTHSQANGEFSHPLVLTNLLSAVLEESGAPLTDKQRAAIARLGTEYDAAYEQKQKGYGDGTPRLEKLVDELELKHACMTKVHGALTPEQEGAAYDPMLRDRMQLDILSPGVATILSAQQQQYASAEEARTKFQQSMLRDLGIDASTAADLGPAFDAWQREVAPLLEPHADQKGPPRLDDALLAARAQVNLLHRLLEAPGIDEKVRAAILAVGSWSFPVVVEKKAQ